MKKLLKKIISVALSAVTAVAVLSFAASCKKSSDIVIGILQVDTHNALDSSRKGFEDTLNAWAKKNGKTIEFNEQNAHGNPNNEITLADSLVSKKPDMLLGIATSSARALALKTTKIPVLFTAVTDPTDSEFKGANVTGTSDKAPVADQIRLIKTVVPDCKKVAFLYHKSEENSLKQVEAAKAECEKLGIECVEKPVADENGIQTVTESIGDDIDAVYLPTDNMISANVNAACSILNARKIPVIAAESGMCGDGNALATLGIDYYNLGVQTAEIAIKILEKTKTPSEIPFEIYNRECSVFVNEKNAAALGLSAERIQAIKDFK